MDRGLLVQQRYLGKAGLIALITVLNMTAPLSTDMYLPSFPTMIEEFAVSARVLNLTLVGFFLFFAVGMLLFGPFSDRYGRKPVLVAGLGLYLAASLACAAAAGHRAAHPVPRHPGAWAQAAWSPSPQPW